MGRGHPGLPVAQAITLRKTDILNILKAVDDDPVASAKVRRLETEFRSRIGQHVGALPAGDAEFGKFNTSPFVLMFHCFSKRYQRISQIENDILPAKQFSSMETSAGRMVESVVLPEYGWEVVPSEMHTANSALDGKHLDGDILRLVTLKSGPRCLNDEMSENFADAIVNNHQEWARNASTGKIDFTYGVLYGTKRQSNKKDWHILRNVCEKMGEAVSVNCNGRWDCEFVREDVHVGVTVRVGLDWWTHLGGENCYVELCIALIRACVQPGAEDLPNHQYGISDIAEIVSTTCVPATYNVALLQRSQFPWLFFLARHFCDSLVD